MSKLLTFEDVANRLNVGKAKAKEIILKNDFTIMDLGHRTKRILETELTEYLKKKSVRRLNEEYIQSAPPKKRAISQSRGLSWEEAKFRKLIRN